MESQRPSGPTSFPPEPEAEPGEHSAWPNIASGVGAGRTRGLGTAADGSGLETEPHLHGHLGDAGGGGGGGGGASGDVGGSRAGSDTAAQRAARRRPMHAVSLGSFQLKGIPELMELMELRWC
jgi:hypothetical protein